MELELKHLAPYLPYGLKCYNDVHKIQTMDCWSDFSTIKGGNRVHIQGVLNGTSIPILRPMSDLIELYEGDETHLICNIVEAADQHCDAYDEWLDIYLDDPEPSRILQSPYEVFEELVKNYFDVFGLIAAGLAIDINNTKKRPDN